MNKVYLAPTLDLAREFAAKSIDGFNAVETEYGSAHVPARGGHTLVHHGQFAGQPAPCVADIVRSNQFDCLVSHIDLDTVGGILASWGQKPCDPEFWAAAAFIDVNGPQHISELSEYVQERLQAYWAWAATQPRVRYTELVEVTDQVIAAGAVLREILNPWTGEPNDPERGWWDHVQAERLEAGRVWAAAQLAATEACLISENTVVRLFETDSVFCNSSYWSPSLGTNVPAVVSFNKKFEAISLSFFDGGAAKNAATIMKAVFGPEAGGHAGIAGTPRGVPFTMADAEALARSLEEEGL